MSFQIQMPEIYPAEPRSCCRPALRTVQTSASTMQGKKAVPPENRVPSQQNVKVLQRLQPVITSMISLDSGGKSRVSLVCKASMFTGLNAATPFAQQSVPHIGTVNITRGGDPTPTPPPTCCRPQHRVGRIFSEVVWPGGVSGSTVRATRGPSGPKDHHIDTVSPHLNQNRKTAKGRDHLVIMQEARFGGPSSIIQDTKVAQPDCSR